MMFHRTALKALLALALTLSLPLAALAGEITVSAAASLTNAFQELKPLFEKASPGATVAFNFAASGPLLKQIEAGAPVDVFASADQKTMDQAAAKNLLAQGTRKDFAANTLVMIAPATPKPEFKTPKDLTAKAVERIAIGSPESVPAGNYTRQSLTADKLFEALQPKFVLGESVRQVLDYVSRGEVQAGFVYKTDALIAGDKVAIVAEMKNHDPVTYPVAVIAASAKKDEAGKFIAFLLSPEAQAVLAKYGFREP
ncbi:Molybdate-binding periplasmic protein [Fundidesulfovibrio magnetotacticus]|uniref:Molybdate-binding periplasmic protein n=1 Tax=Fundidesulfovibrio magnetotacticus TaxID=2730080 RepID=A0A6V8LR63_9BACT|nr:molybdate ABC transporter substrate-binding protein [Fundidesulfovibrio magnetotacticus]GFK94204.1 Molybdate-binding periplasmic protein [Fundidesulfovibrio magnetotacticus]